MKIPKDRRNKLWHEIEGKIQKISPKKDRNLKLNGFWKKFYKKESNFKVYKVNGNWVRANLSIIFRHGGHGLVHEFIPHYEIWVGTYHQNKCGCKKVRKDRLISENYTKSIILHEITEYNEMKRGKIFWDAHCIALSKEREAKILDNPYTEKYH